MSGPTPPTVSVSEARSALIAESLSVIVRVDVPLPPVTAALLSFSTPPLSETVTVTVVSAFSGFSVSVTPRLVATPCCVKIGPAATTKVGAPFGLTSFTVSTTLPEFTVPSLALTVIARDRSVPPSVGSAALEE